MADESCKPKESQLSKLIPQDSCACEENTNDECVCTLTDLQWNYAIGACMKAIGIVAKDSQKVIDIKFANYMCVLKGLIDDIDSDFDCSDIKIPGSYYGFDFVGTEHTASYDLSSASYAGDDQIVIDGTSHDVSSFNQGQLVTFLNNLNLGIFTASGTTISVTDYHDYGTLTINGDDFTPTITDTGNEKTLCNALAFISTKFSDIHDNNVLQNNVGGTATGTAGSYETLATYNLQGGTLATDGDKLLVEYDLITPFAEQGDNDNAKRVEIRFNGNSLGEYAFEGLIDMHKLKATISRKDNTIVYIQFEDVNFVEPFSGIYLFNDIFPTIQEIGGLNLTTTDYTIEVRAKSINTGDIICKSAQIDILRK